MSPSHDDDPGPGAGHRRSSRPELIEAPDRRAPTAPLGDPESVPLALELHRAEFREPQVWLWRRLVGTAFAFVAISVAWYLVKVPDGLISDRTLPGQTQVARAFDEARVNGYAGSTLGGHLRASLGRFLLGASIGALVGRLIGLAMGSAPLARTVLDPVLSHVRMVPAIAIGPLLVVWFGAGQAAMVAVVALVTLLASAESAATFRVREVRHLSTAGRLHEMVSGLRQALVAGWAATLAIETILAPVGLGPMIWSAQDRTDMVLAGIFVAGLTGLVLDTILRAAEYLAVSGADRQRLLAGWRPMGNEPSVRLEVLDGEPDVIDLDEPVAGPAEDRADADPDPDANEETVAGRGSPRTREPVTVEPEAAKARHADDEGAEPDRS